MTAGPVASHVIGTTDASISSQHRSWAEQHIHFRSTTVNHRDGIYCSIAPFLTFFNEANTLFRRQEVAYRMHASQRGLDTHYTDATSNHISQRTSRRYCRASFSIDTRKNYAAAAEFAETCDSTDEECSCRLHFLPPIFIKFYYFIIGCNSPRLH